MALIKVQEGGSGNPPQKLPICHVCGLRKPGLFTINPQGKQECEDCAAARGKPIGG